MTIALGQPDVAELHEAVASLGEWQYESAPLQLHPGDLGWHWQFGAEATAAAVRTWRRDGRILAVGFLDGPDLVRMGVTPEADHDEELARQVIADLTDTARGVLPEGPIHVEARAGAALRDLLSGGGWEADEAWTPLRRTLDSPVEDPGLRIEVITPGREAALTAVHRSAFGSPKFTDERWQTMISGPAYADARGLVAYDDQDEAVATVTVWSAGEGRPGLLEPMGVHADHRGRGYGRAISVAAAAALQAMGSSSATVGTPSTNVGAVATYAAAGFQVLSEVKDRRREAQ